MADESLESSEWVHGMQLRALRNARMCDDHARCNSMHGPCETHEDEDWPREKPRRNQGQRDSVETNKTNARSGNLLIVEAVQVYSKCRQLNVPTSTDCSWLYASLLSGPPVDFPSLRYSPATKLEPCRRPVLSPVLSSARGYVSIYLVRFNDALRADRMIPYPSEYRWNQPCSHWRLFTKRKITLGLLSFHRERGELVAYTMYKIIPRFILLRLTLINVIINSTVYSL